jgi:FdhD protein
LENVELTVSVDQCFRLMRLMQESSTIFQDTGGVPEVALCDTNSIIVDRTDIGRHNAVDKIYGHCLKHSFSLSVKIIEFSGRISSEVFLKVAEIGCGIVLSKSAPTEVALKLAEELYITNVGFLRNQSLNIYTRPGRIEVQGVQMYM